MRIFPLEFSPFIINCETMMYDKHYYNVHIHWRYIPVGVLALLLVHN
ncbi:hypothetical protein VCD_003051 [Vibrio cholerae MJ-1236]|nr:hypothetical protein VCD_001183 [Vibrio cholerae MJ-1236]ACQ60682.1 hypothetical protein VCD_002516 [Vibrio cholerae MJ-1236]ACQ60789.1 hypothetical protein VCD_002623 [Vibrio cholerae MJ-1236]ACQ61211.1 hypothetical protein VCD_003051 [Vibrio cholerae MJ-1236]